MAEIQPSGTSIAAPAAAAPIESSSPVEGEVGGGGRGVGEDSNEDVPISVQSAKPRKNVDIDAPREDHAAAVATNPHNPAEHGSKQESLGADQHSTSIFDTPSASGHDTSANNPEESISNLDMPQAHKASTTVPSSPDLGQTPATTLQPHVPPKRFTSVNINKRFLEKTPSASGPSSGSSHAVHASTASSASGSAQRRGASPNSRSPSTDRPASSRLVTAKLTAVQQPAAASTSGWLRTNSTANSTTTTPPSSSPQPTVHEANAFQSSGSLQQKRRPGGSPVPNGTSASGSTSSGQQQGAKPVWGKVPVRPPSGGLGRRTTGEEMQNDFPTAAEAAHGHKAKILKAQSAAQTAAAQTEAHKQAMLETAAAFRGAHLDANARHWDEMEDEDNDFLAGVIEFGDGTQYKIEHKPEVASLQDQPPPPEPTTEASHSELPVTKEERFGEDIGRSWPRARASPIHTAGPTSLPSRSVPSQQQPGPHRSPTDGPVSGSPQSPYDGTSPTSRVLFNERSNRLEPWSNAKPRLGPPQGPGPVPRRDNRDEHSSFPSLRQPPPLQTHSRDVTPHHPSAPNVQLLQKGSSGSDSVWKSGPPRGFGQGSDRGRWGEGSGNRGVPSAKDDDRSGDMHRRESMSSTASARDRSRGRESRWDTNTTFQGRGLDTDRVRRNSNTSQQFIPPLPPSLERDAGRQVPPHLSRMPPPPVPPMRSAQGRDTRPPLVSPSISVRSSLISPVSEQAPSVPSVSALSVPPVASKETLDKDALVKDAMHLAIERAKRRKQEGEEEEKRRLEAAERAKKKAEALAVAQEEKRRAEAAVAPGSEKDKPVGQPSQVSKPTTKTVEKAPEADQDPQRTEAGVDVPISRPFPTQGPALSAPSLPRKPTIPHPPTLATQAESWRSKAAPVATPAPRIWQPAPPQSRGSLPLTTKIPELDLSVQPDEQIEVVDFCDMEKLMGSPHKPASPVQASESGAGSSPIRTRWPATNDFFGQRPSEPRETSLSKTEELSWRRSESKSTSTLPPTTSDEPEIQATPASLAELDMPLNNTPSVGESKPPVSPTLERHASQGDRMSSSSASQSAHVSPVAIPLRSPRNSSHFKEAPMSTLTDTMSRIKGALDDMQLQEPPTSKDVPEKPSDNAVSTILSTEKTKTNDFTVGSWREVREPRPHILRPVTNKAFSQAFRPIVREVFDITRAPPPRSPKPVWNAFVVNLPKESYHREPLSRKQLHFWNLPHAPVRWEILSWEPPVEGMNKRELSRDEIFHRKHAVKGGRLRVCLPTRRSIPLMAATRGFGMPQDNLHSTSQTALVTASGVKIKLPSDSPPVRSSIAPSSKPVAFGRPRDSSSVPSWRRSATPLTALNKDPNGPAVNGSPSDHQLNTMSRSPPPEPSTPLPHLPEPKTIAPLGSSSAHSATVSLPAAPSFDGKQSTFKRLSGSDVVFFRTARGETETGSNKPLPQFMVSSEIDVGEHGGYGSAKHSTSSDTVEFSSQTVNMSSNYSLRAASQTPPPRLLTGKSESKSSDESGPGMVPVTPPSTHTSSTWGKSPLSFSLKESPARSAPDPEHLKAVWSQASGRPTGTTANSLKGITDDMPSIPFTVQDMKSEDGETPPPTAPAPPPSRLSLQEVTRAFQQVPEAPASSNASRTPSAYTQMPLLSPGHSQNHRSNQPVGISLPSAHNVRSAYAPYPPSIIGHSPSPTMMYAPTMSSPVPHHRMAVPSPPIIHGMWLPTPPPAPQPGSFMRPAGGPPPQIMYPTAGPSPGAPGQMVHRRMSIASPGNIPPSSTPSMYPGHPMDMQNHMHARSPHIAHTHAVGHPMPPMHAGQMFSPPQPGQLPGMYAVPVGAGRGGMVPRPAYESYPPVPPHSGGYQSVPTTSFVFQS